MKPGKQASTDGRYYCTAAMLCMHFPTYFYFFLTIIRRLVHEHAGHYQCTSPATQLPVPLHDLFSVSSPCILDNEVEDATPALLCCKTNSQCRTGCDLVGIHQVREFYCCCYSSILTFPKTLAGCAECSITPCLCIGR